MKNQLFSCAAIVGAGALLLTVRGIKPAQAQYGDSHVEFHVQLGTGMRMSTIVLNKNMKMPTIDWT